VGQDFTNAKPPERRTFHQPRQLLTRCGAESLVLRKAFNEI
jgi:hypothetical protein